MKRIKYTTFLALIMISSILNGQTCTHVDLSNNYDFISNIERYKINDGPDSCIITVNIICKKTNHNVHTIIITDFLLSDSSYINCNNIRSYITQKNQNNVVIENDYGDIIIADINFDNKEDIAIKKEDGGNGGPVYVFFIQKDDSFFEYDKYLSEIMQYYPEKINKNKKTLTTFVRANTYQNCRTIFKYNQKKNRWKKIKTILE
jgi:hypothetical protein